MNRETEKKLTALEIEIIAAARDLKDNGEYVSFFLELGAWATKNASDIMKTLLEEAEKLRRERE